MKPEEVERATRGDLHVVADVVSPCSYCGVPCSGTFRLWYVDGDERNAFEVDRLTLEALLAPLVEAASDAAGYARLSTFIRNWNEGVGWAGMEEAAPVAAADMLVTIEALKAHHGNHGRLKAALASLEEFVVRGCQQQREFWAGET